MALTSQRIIDAPFFNQETDPTPIDQTYILIDHDSWDEPRKVLHHLNVSDSGVLLGGNLITSSGWAFNGWAGNESIGWTHNIGNTTPLSNVLSAIIDSTYQIQITVSGCTTGSFIATFGGDTSPALISTTNYSITATTNGNLIITPSSNFDGTILISIKEAVWKITEPEMLDILGKPALYGQDEVDALLLAKVDKVTNKSLIAESEITRLLGVKQNVYTLYLAASSDVATRLLGLIEGTDYPSGWTLAADSGVNLLVSHNLIDRHIVDVKVWENTGSGWRLLSFDKGTSYTGIINNGLDVLIEGFAPNGLPMKVYLIFD